MQNSALGNLGRRVIAWIVLAFVAIVLVKLAIGLVAGLVQAAITVLLLVAVGFGIVWALRHI